MPTLPREGRGRPARAALWAVIAAAVWLAPSAMGEMRAGAEPRHGLSIFGDLKYGPNFTHFEYTDPGAPKGGEVRLADYGSFDNLNPFILKGIQLRGIGAGAMGLPFESLMAPAEDEPDSLYGLVAASVEVAPDRSWVRFTLRPQARWHDGSPITAADVVFSFHILKEQGRPFFRLSYRDIVTAEAEAADVVRFEFAPGASRDLPLLAARMPMVRNFIVSASAA